MVPAATIYTDCASALATARRCQGAGSLLPFLGKEDFDLVSRLWNRVRQGDYEFYKVSAHVQVSHDMPVLQIYNLWGNQKANAAAIHTCWHAMPGLVAQALALHASHQKKVHLLERVLALRLELRKARAQLEANQNAMQTHQQVFRQTGLTPFEILRNWAVPGPWVVPSGRIHQLADCLWGLN